MNERDEFGFCPRCGAVMKNGVCQNCGYGKKSAGAADAPAEKRPRSRKKGRSTGGRIVFGICVGAGVLIVLLVLFFLGVSVWMAVKQAGQSQNQTPGYGYTDPYGGSYGYGNPYGGWEDDSSGYYVPDEDDEFYEQITDATSLELSYKVVWQSVCVHPDDPDDRCMYDCVYPVLTGEEDAAARFERMNRRIRELACAYEDSWRDYKLGAASYGYVTYMDEEKVSIVVEHRRNEEGASYPELRAVTFLVETGEEIPYEEIRRVDSELVKQFRFRNSAQNGTVEFVEELSDEELQTYLRDKENSIMFYTPVGLELGFNYENGWVTVTLKKQAV